MKRLILLIPMLMLLCSCTVTVTKTDSPAAARPKTNFVGDASVSGAKSLNIDWPSGKVVFIEGEDEGFRFQEACDRELTEAERLHWGFTDDTLYISAAAEGATLLNTEKTLTVMLPKDFTLEELTVSVSSADVEAGLLRAKSLNISASSGEVELTVDAPEQLQISTASGDVKLTLPVDSGFTLELDTASGSFSSELPLKNDGSRYTAGNGKAVFRISTASGDVELLTK